MEEVPLGRFADGKLIKRLLAYLLPYRRTVLAAVACMLAHSALETAGPLLTKLAIDRYLAPGRRPQASLLDPWLPADPWSGVAMIAGLFLLALLAGLLFQFAQAYLMSRAGQFAISDLRRQTMAHFQKLDISYYDKAPVGRMLTRITSDADALNELFSAGIVALIGDLLTLALVLAVMWTMSPTLTLILGAAVPALIAISMRFRASVTKANRRIRAAVAAINAHLQEHLSGVAVLQLFNREKKSCEEFEAINREHMEAYKQAIVAYGWFYPLVEFTGMATLALLLAWGGWRIQSGALSLGVLVAFFQYGLRVFRPIQDLSEKYNILVSAAAAAERIFQVLDTPVQIRPPVAAAARNLPDGPAKVEFDHVWFAYKDQEWVLEDVSFTIEPGETIAVVGHTGAGKTTLISLLLRFYDVQKGAIRINGIDIRDLDPQQLRRRFAIVLQDSFLFQGSIADNISLGDPDISDSRLREAIESVNLDGFIDSLPDGVHHPLRERGAGVSTGQKQLISFARALARNPPFLILDEATSSVDAESELRIRQALERLIEGRTSLIIAHRLSTIQRASRIFVLHKGRLREVGTHQQLLALRGIYWRLYQLQYKEAALNS